MTNNNAVRRLILVSSSQVGKSELENNIIGYIIDQDPSSILFIHPTTIDAKDYSKLRIAPMLRDTPALRRKVSPAKSRDSGNTILQKTYPGGILTLCGSTEAHALAPSPSGTLSVTSATAGRSPPGKKATRGNWPWRGRLLSTTQRRWKSARQPSKGTARLLTLSRKTRRAFAVIPRDC